MPNTPPLPWPEHFYIDHHHVRCIVPGCAFATYEESIIKQWTRLHDHCENTPGAEHALLEIMLRQRKCALCGYGPFSSFTPSGATRALYRHEITRHGSAEMFKISSFVTLAREGRPLFSIGGGHMALEPNCRRLAFARMMEKIQDLDDAEINLLFQRGGYTADERTAGNLREILSRDAVAPPNAHYWYPVRPEDFLMSCRPHAADNVWRRLWTDLRDKYTHGRI